MRKKQIKNQVVSLAKKSKKYIKPTLYVIGALILLYGLIYLFTKKDHIPADLQATIDSLTNENKKLVEKQHQIDSTIKLYEAEVEQVDTKISDVKEKTTIIREYYHEQAQTADKYTPTQVDSFFKARYNY
jgi:uncharacterized membrane protein